LQDAVREILLREWDPIGIGREDAAKNEYDTYVTKICALIAQRQSVEDVIKISAIGRNRTDGIAGRC
jgi:hypothetical protein